ncbi:Txe/YoeB family addiction module toxin [Oxalobacteraceae bacterium A2-2]
MSRKKAENKAAAKHVVLAWSDIAWDDYLHWQKEDLDKAEKINALLEECMRTPFKGTGKPEPLKGNLTGYWSRRIDREHRLVYLVEDGVVYVAQCRHHY